MPHTHIHTHLLCVLLLCFSTGRLLRVSLSPSLSLSWFSPSPFKPAHVRTLPFSAPASSPSFSLPPTYRPSLSRIQNPESMLAAKMEKAVMKRHSAALSFLFLLFELAPLVPVFSCFATFVLFLETVESPWAFTFLLFLLAVPPNEVKKRKKLPKSSQVHESVK